MFGEAGLQEGCAIPRGPRSTGRKRSGEAWIEVAKRAKFQGALTRTPRPRPKAAQADEEAEVVEALLSFTAPPDKPVSSKVVKSEDGYEEAHPPRGRGGGRGRSDRRAVKAQEHGRGAWASQGEGEGVRNGIATPKAVKAATSSASAGPSLSLPGLQAGPGPHINLGMGLGAFAGTFPNGLNGAYYPGGAAAAAQAAAAQAQGALWPPSFPAAMGGAQARDEGGEGSGGGGQEVLMPPQRRNWKRCASHVYIAHFIEYQMHKDRHAKQQQQRQQQLRSDGSDGLTTAEQQAPAAAQQQQRGGGNASGGRDAASGPERLGADPAGPMLLPHQLLPGGSVSQGVPPGALHRAAPCSQAPSSNGGSYGAFSQPLSAIAAAAAALPRAGSSAQASNQPGGVPSSHQQQQHSQAPPLQQQQQQQHSGFAPSQYAQQLQNHLLLQQGGGFPFLSPGMAHLGGQFSANGGLTPQQAATVANAFPFPGGAHMLSLAGFGGLGQLGGAGGQLGGFVPRKMDLKDGLGGDVAALKRAAAAHLKPEDALKLGLGAGLGVPSDAAARLHALGVPSAMLNGAVPNGASGSGGGGAGGPPGMGPPTMAGFHEQLLAAAAAQQRPEAQGVPVLR